MAIFNEILSARFARALQKVFSMKGPPPVRAVAGEISPALPFFWGREARYLESWQGAMGQGFQAALAANFSVVRLRNPAGSNVVLVVEKISAVESSAAGGVALIFNLPPDVGDLGAFGTWVNTDSRSGSTGANGNAGLLGRISVGTRAAQGGPIVSVIQAAVTASIDFIITDIQEIVLLPGSSMEVVTPAVNQNLQVSYQWRERALEESERT